LEVLISMFVILFGLLGVAALLEVGRSESASATRQDRAMACGVSGLAEIRARQYPNANGKMCSLVNPYLLQQAVTNPQINLVYGPVTDQGGHVHNEAVDARISFCIDPLYVAANSSLMGGNYVVAQDIQVFPYRDQSLTNYMNYMNTAPNVAQRMTRVTCLPRIPNPNYPPNPPPYIFLTPPNPTVDYNYFDRFFTWRDDQVFDLPTDPLRRPQRLFDPTTGIGQLEGNYSWLITATPTSPADFYDASNNPYHDLRSPNPHSYKVSVAVFYKRDMLPPPTTFDGMVEPAERLVWVDAFGGGLGGGDMRLWIAQADMGQEQATAYLNVRENEWLMLCGTDGVRQKFQWYRVLAAGEVYQESSPPGPVARWCRNVTLAGPDWASAVPTAAALFTGIVAVYPDPDSIED
jgi:hypothetical protein